MKPARIPKSRPKGFQTRWEKKRILRDKKRINQGKKTLAEPLVLASPSERRAALAKGQMLSYNGPQKIELPLVITLNHESLVLQGAYRTPDSRILTLRFSPSHDLLSLYEFEMGPEPTERAIQPAWITAEPSLGHMEISRNLRGRGIGLKAASKAERTNRAIQQGHHQFRALNRFTPVFSKLHYALIEEGEFASVFFLKKENISPVITYRLSIESKLLIQKQAKPEFLLFQFQ